MPRHRRRRAGSPTPGRLPDRSGSPSAGAWRTHTIMDTVHESHGRVRLRAASARDARLAPAFVAMVPQHVPGVRDARANPTARSLIIRYDGSPQTRDAVLRLVAETPPAPWAGRTDERRPASRHLR